MPSGSLKRSTIFERLLTFMLPSRRTQPYLNGELPGVSASCTSSLFVAAQLFHQVERLGGIADQDNLVIRLRLDMVQESVKVS